MKPLWVGLLILTLTGCANGYGRPKLPYDAWYIGIAAPRYMEVWVESVDVVDQRGLAFERVHAGVAGYTRKPEGWHNGGGSMKSIGNVDLPEIIFVRWQSLVEPQTYNVRINIPQWVRDEMVKPQQAYCIGRKVWETGYRDSISIGMAPGGIAKVWVGGPCLAFKEIGRFQAKIDKRGPNEGLSDGEYYRPPTEAARKYIQEHGIPYGSW
ncbi:DUF2931 family protein [Pseudomonas citronellolis]|uniref:DUF2931 family protein n=1 Tax=Pseudomonas citronellolis TaxID=53408 RepID=UPI00209E7A02|nr:DUF2931 family protein [Pseudomonas citronellolis]MCP1603819.1 hypothetical protein [Pseudomonas citronellolis]MCP1654531.1 hypothetical protein [Pseudomonas citronellolis]MCP1721477.1 hypothetical protein [Pseudomonas citronellolis]